LSTVRMRRNLALELIRLLDHRFQLFERVLSRTNRIAFGQHASSSARLDHVRSVLHLITDSRANLVWSIGDAIFDATVQQSRAKGILIAVPTVNTQCVTRSHDARPRCPTFV